MKIQKYIVDVGWKLKFMFGFMEITHELLHLDKWSLLQSNILNAPTSFVGIVILFDEGFKFNVGTEF